MVLAVMLGLLNLNPDALLVFLKGNLLKRGDGVYLRDLILVTGVPDSSAYLGQCRHDIDFCVILVFFAYDECPAELVEDVLSFETGGRVKVERLDWIKSCLYLKTVWKFRQVFLKRVSALRADNPAFCRNQIRPADDFRDSLDTVNEGMVVVITAILHT